MNQSVMGASDLIDALQFWVDLSKKHGVMKPGIIEWGTTPKDFFERKVGMMWTTTGNLTNVRANAKFPFGVAMLPNVAGQFPQVSGMRFRVDTKAPAAGAALHKRLASRR